MSIRHECPACKQAYGSEDRMEKLKEALREIKASTMRILVETFS